MEDLEARAHARRVAALSRAERREHLAVASRAERQRPTDPLLVWGFHLIAAAVAAGVLWSFSVPGFDFFLLAASGCAAVLVVGFWFVWVMVVANRTGRRWRWFLIGPVIAALALVLLGFGAPLQLRWAVSRDAFVKVVAGQPIPPPGSEWRALKVPDQLGSYQIVAAFWVPGGAVFHEANGNFFDDAGFAYLPGGPTAELSNGNFESPRFRPLGGGWYRWTASW